jgi:hypothetical protein
MTDSHRGTEVDIWVARMIGGFLLIAKETGYLCCCRLTEEILPQILGEKNEPVKNLTLFGGKNPCTNSSKKEKEKSFLCATMNSFVYQNSFGCG